MELSTRIAQCNCGTMADNNGVISVKRTTRAIYPDVAQYSSTIIFLLCSH